MSETTNPVAILSQLLRCPSITPDNGDTLNIIANILKNIDFTVIKKTFSDKNAKDVNNLYARLGDSYPHLLFAGHSDVVPVGCENNWKHPPFAAIITDGKIFGRGAVDMKGGIACFIAAVARHLERVKAIKGSISFLITGDEEGPAINGSVKLLEWAKNQGEKWNGAIVGEPTNPETLGQMVKIGRRGSISGKIIIHGKQGHVAYPHLANNPVNSMIHLLNELILSPLDHGNDDFSPSNLEIISIDTGNKAFNVIPAMTSALFNIRFNNLWNSKKITKEIENRIEKAARRKNIRHEIQWKRNPSEAFLGKNNTLVEILTQAIKKTTGMIPELSTSGGTSDARFIKNYCPLVEFGLIGKTMHMIDEHSNLEDLEKLTQIYQLFIDEFLSKALSE